MSHKVMPTVGARVKFINMPETYPRATVVEMTDNWVKCRLDKTITHMGYEENEKPLQANDPTVYPKLRTDVIVFDFGSSLQVLDDDEA
jgi:hypothetical protein